ncbi:hypothetical protein GKP39 (plasmid) [Geobacillus kaustophilus HTA426]|uniref:Uncharacterized protein n=1 Tax=Geobacillus kaustophilus (strain HTA426) TaxID=235909 RepID=Q5QL28_GEOKA|nr:hypothetical protein GKP39 [Geobacillus kaustophilus HTA426]
MTDALWQLDVLRFAFNDAGALRAHQLPVAGHKNICRYELVHHRFHLHRINRLLGIADQNPRRPRLSVKRQFQRLHCSFPLSSCIDNMAGQRRAHVPQAAARQAGDGGGGIIKRLDTCVALHSEGLRADDVLSVAVLSGVEVQNKSAARHHF